MVNQMLKKRKLINFKIGDLVQIKISKIDRFRCKYGILNVSYYNGELETLGTTTYPELDEIPLNQISIREATRLQSVGLISCSICNCKGPCDNNRCKCKKKTRNVQLKHLLRNVLNPQSASSTTAQLQWKRNYSDEIQQYDFSSDESP
ncbi:hypothetical protein Glove_186g76 [Diversispora epigaea]|uniref:Uncharacterized protein n=1 Tax=Diversispora epigaea TaxID=1348612 RepID=A0A397IMD4_9GLOM|nr:hypothetical protein Glove_186g76 [Diversispora epigaea]